MSYSNGKLVLINAFENTFKLILYFAIDFLTLVSFRYLNLYKEKHYINILNQLVQIIKAIFLSALLLIIATFFLKLKPLDTDSRLHVVLFCTTNIVFIFIYRSGLLHLYQVYLKNKGIFNRRVLAIGAGEVGKRFVEELISKGKYLIEVVGFIDDDETKIGTNLAGIKVLDNTKNLKEIVENYDIDEIFITIESISYERILTLIQRAKEAACQVNLVSSHYHIINRKVDTIEYKDLISVPIFHSLSPFYSQYLKRAFDLAVGSLSLLLYSPLFILLAILIKLSSPGPVFYKSYVIGKNGNKFVWFKFRSMLVNDNQIHQQHLKEIIQQNKTVEKIKNDPRITPVGRIIRKYSFDELPQLINVIRGDMSMVGPRPCSTYEYDMMENWQRKRFKVTPGITGLWQILGRNRPDVNFTESIIMDLYYSDNISLWFDLKILLKTIPVVIFGKGGS